MPPDITSRNASCNSAFVERLGTKPHGPGVDRLDDVTVAVGRRNHHHRQARIGGAEFDQHVEAVGVAQVQVEQDEVEIGFQFQHLARQLGGGRTDHGHIITQAEDDALQRREDQRVVVNQQDLHRHCLR